MKVEPRPLIPSDVRSAPVEAVRPVNSRQATAFEAVLKTRKTQTRRSLRSDLEALTAAAGVDSLLFGGARSLELLELQPAGKRRISADDFSRGYRPAAGERLGE